MCLFRKKFGFSDSDSSNLQIIKVIKVFLTNLYTTLINIGFRTAYNLGERYLIS
jgi:hypothetical protein